MKALKLRLRIWKYELKLRLFGSFASAATIHEWEYRLRVLRGRD